MLIIPVKLSEFLRLKVEETLENLNELSAEGARQVIAESLRLKDGADK